MAIHHRSAYILPDIINTELALTQLLHNTVVAEWSSFFASHCVTYYIFNIPTHLCKVVKRIQQHVALIICTTVNFLWRINTSTIL